MSHLHLTELSLHDNELENIECDHIPRTVVELDLGKNKITSICNLALFTQLTELILAQNQLTTVNANHIPPNLQNIYLAYNLFDCESMENSRTIPVNCGW